MKVPKMESIEAILRGLWDRPTSKPLRIMATLFLLVDIFIALVAIWKGYFALSMGFWGFLGQVVLRTITGATGYLIWATIIIFYILVPLLSGGNVRIPSPSVVVEKSLNKARGLLSNTRLSICLLGVGCLGMAVLLLVLRLIPSPFAPPPAGRLVIPSDRTSSKLFVIDSSTSTVVAFDREQRDQSGMLRALWYVHITEVGAHLEQIAVTYDQKRIFATDSSSGMVFVIDANKQQEETRLDVGKGAGAMAISADGRKLYVAVVGSGGPGAIHVFDTHSLKEIEHPIGNVGCPMALFAPPRAPRLFVATQCGGGKDPLYIFDTRNDKRIAKIPDLAVGWGVISTPDGRKAFVSTGDPSTFNVVSDLETRKPKIRKWEMPMTAMAITADGQTVFVGTDHAIRAFDVRAEKWCGSVPLESDPPDIAIAPDGWLYSRMPTRFYYSDASALACR